MPAAITAGVQEPSRFSLMSTTVFSGTDMNDVLARFRGGLSCKYCRKHPTRKGNLQVEFLFFVFKALLLRSVSELRFVC